MKNKSLTVKLSEQEKVQFLRSAIDRLQGKMFGMVNQKQDGSLRTWRGVRTGVSKHSKGVGRSKPLPSHLVSVWEPHENGGQYRTVNLRTVTEFRASKQNIKFA